MGILSSFFEKTIAREVKRQAAIADIRALRPDPDLAKSLGDPVLKHIKAQMWDPMSIFQQQGSFYERPSRLTFETLTRMALQNPIIAAIENTRLNQVCTFSRRAAILEQTQNRPMGFKVVHKFKHPKKLTNGEKKFIDQMERTIEHCGYTPPFDKELMEKRDNFVAFLKKIVRQRLRFDQVTFEKVRNRKGEPAEWWAVDAATIRIAAREDKKRGISYVQVINGLIQASYEHEELAFCVANPRADLGAGGYGFSELEQLIHTVTAQLYADAYNMKFFSQGMGVPGILNLAGEDRIPEDDLIAFRQMFQAMATGAINSWKTPITNVKKLEWIPLKGSNRDMEYQAWVEYLIKVSCAVYQIDPGEINFYFHSSGGDSAPLFEAHPEAKLKHSKDKGLRPLLDFVADFITEHIIQPYDDNYCLHFAGLDAKDEKEVVEIRSEELKSYKKLDEVREEANLPPVGGALGEMILNPDAASFYQGEQMKEQEGQGEEKTEPEEGESEVPGAEEMEE